MITMFTATDKKCRIILHFLSENERRLKELAERKKKTEMTVRGFSFLVFFPFFFFGGEKQKSVNLSLKSRRL